jgi:hypothetical protein
MNKSWVSVLMGVLGLGCSGAEDPVDIGASRTG